MRRRVSPAWRRRSAPAALGPLWGLADRPAKTVPEFIAYAKVNPGKINYGSAGVGSSLHMAGELFKLMAGVDLVHVPYRGSPPALNDLLSGQLQLMFSPLPPSIEYIRTGRLRALAVTTSTRSQTLPEVPVIALLCA